MLRGRLRAGSDFENEVAGEVLNLAIQIGRRSIVRYAPISPFGVSQWQLGSGGADLDTLSNARLVITCSVQAEILKASSHVKRQFTADRKRS